MSDLLYTVFFTLIPLCVCVRNSVSIAYLFLSNLISLFRAASSTTTP